MIRTRFGVFETNSSSTHSIVICPKSEYEKFRSGQLFFDYWNDALVTREEIIANLRYEEERYKSCRNPALGEIEAMTMSEFAAAVDDEKLGDRYRTYENWESDYLEQYMVNYTSPSGDEIVIFGEYGHD